MSRMTKRNRNNIKRIFVEKTGVELDREHGIRAHSPVRKLVALTAAMLCCFALAAFTYPLFSPLDGDELTLSATYEGDGIVSIFVENGSDKDLEFQKKAKLVSWVPEEEVERLEGEILFENTRFPAHSSGTMTVDISKAYDIEALEGEGRNFAPYYLLLTNNDFLFGHDWMCSFTFETKEREEPYETQPPVVEAVENAEEIEESLRFYFENAYHNETLAWNEKNFTYLQKVDELIKRFQGNVISPVFPMILVSGPSTYLDPQPSISEDVEFDFVVPAEGIVSVDWTVADGYRRLVGAAASEKTLTVSANIPLKEFSGVSAIPLIYTFVFEAGSVQNKADYAFFYGQFHSFAELEECKVYADENYAIYDVTDYFYTDLDAYMDYVEQTREDLQIDDRIRQQIRSVYDYYRKNLGALIYYPELR